MERLAIDRRPNLKPLVLNLVCWAEGDSPAFVALADGNQSDKTHFTALLQTFQFQWHSEGLSVAASALYSEDKLHQLSGTAFQPTSLEGDRIASVGCYYDRVQQRWFVVASQERQKADLNQFLNQLKKTLDREMQPADPTLANQRGKETQRPTLRWVF